MVVVVVVDAVEVLGAALSVGWEVGAALASSRADARKDDDGSSFAVGLDRDGPPSFLLIARATLCSRVL